MAYSGYNNAPGNASDGGKKKKKVAIVGISSIILVAMVVAVAVGVSQRNASSASTSSGHVSASMKAIQSICAPTDYKETCVNSLKSANSTDPRDLIRTGFSVTMDQIRDVVKNSSLLKNLAKDSRTNQALENCDELMDYAIDDLKASFDQLGKFDVSKMSEYVRNLNVWMSGAVTYQETCLDGFENTTGNAGEAMKKLLKNSRELTSNGLAMVADLGSIVNTLQIPGVSRRLLEEVPEDFPAWVGDGERRLLLGDGPGPKPNVVVAKDGSGDFKTVNEAVNGIPKKRNTTYVIYIKEGIYAEQVMVDKSMTFVMMIGDGPLKTKITGNKNYVDGTQTYKTSTVSIIGDNFIAKDMGFENTAGPMKHQAVALRVHSDMAIFHNCQMDGYQDTVYAHAHRQFYRDCTISGTIDFIFGDATAVFQNCRMVVRAPLPNQQCIVTAQGRSDRRQGTGIVLQGCTFVADPLLDTNVTSSFLGRPWKEFSRTVVMQSHLEDLISPDGWLPWMGDFALNTCFYGEYDNKGPGSAMAKRVTWPGVHVITAQSAVDFTPAAFIGGDDWIKPTGVPYTSGMMTAPAA